MATPYDKYKQTNEWEIISNSIQALIENQDIKLMTSVDLVIGYITKEIIERSSIIRAN